MKSSPLAGLFRPLVLCCAAAALAIALPDPARAQASSGTRAADELRQMRNDLHEIRLRCRVKRWDESVEMLLRIKKAFSKSTPTLLTRLSPEDVSHFSYALASVEDGLSTRDLGQLEQGFQLSQSSVTMMKSKFPGDLDQELDDLQQAAAQVASNSAKGDAAEVQYYLEEIAAGRRRLDTAAMAYSRESWVHFGLAAENLARAARSRNIPATQAAAQAVAQDLRDIRDRIANR
ncbi:MAG: hypothetical protein HZB25_00530 [Candidatus Eisenbacteria bacterium]|nr:hypothetical protein [Candidatus Eisenbacteria bacterium]